MKDLLFEVPMDGAHYRHATYLSQVHARTTARQCTKLGARAKLHFRPLKTRSRGSASGCLGCSTERGVSCRVEDVHGLDTEDHGRALRSRGDYPEPRIPDSRRWTLCRGLQLKVVVGVADFDESPRHLCAVCPRALARNVARLRGHRSNDRRSGDTPPARFSRLRRSSNRGCDSVRKRVTVAHPESRSN
jgi:hypothetical protein